MGVFKKARKKRISNKITKLKGKITELEGEGMGVFLPEWNEGGKEIFEYTNRIVDLQDRLKKFNLGGASHLFDAKKDKSIRIPGMYDHLDNMGKIKP